jgi:hypothetical protein
MPDRAAQLRRLIEALREVEGWQAPEGLRGAVIERRHKLALTTHDLARAWGCTPGDVISLQGGYGATKLVYMAAELWLIETAP